MRPRLFDYDVASDEEIVTEGVEGAVPTWVGIAIDRQIIHIVCQEGVLNVTGDALDVVTRSGQQETMEGSDVVDFYQANKATIDDLLRAAMETWAARRGKTGIVVES